MYYKKLSFAATVIASLLAMSCASSHRVLIKHDTISVVKYESRYIDTTSRHQQDMAKADINDSAMECITDYAINQTTGQTYIRRQTVKQSGRKSKVRQISDNTETHKQSANIKQQTKTESTTATQTKNCKDWPWWLLIIFLVLGGIMGYTMRGMTE